MTTGAYRFRVFLSVAQLIRYCDQRWPEQMARQRSEEPDPNVKLNKIAEFAARHSAMSMTAALQYDHPDVSSAAGMFAGMMYNGMPGFKNNSEHIQAWLDGYNDSTVWARGYKKPDSLKEECFINTDDQQFELNVNLVYQLEQFFANI